jgi:hypothetical protein
MRNIMPSLEPPTTFHLLSQYLRMNLNPWASLSARHTLSQDARKGCQDARKRLRFFALGAGEDLGAGGAGTSKVGTGECGSSTVRLAVCFVRAIGTNL